MRHILIVGAAVVALSAGMAAVRADEPKKAPITLGDGKTTFTLDEDWGKLPAGMTYSYK